MKKQIETVLDINLKTEEGQLLFVALLKLVNQVEPDKTEREMIAELQELRKHYVPHADCDNGCYQLCSKGGTEWPECMKSDTP